MAEEATPPEASTSLPYKFVEPKFKVHTFSTEIEDKAVLYQVLVMKDSLMIFINYKSDRCLNDMTIAMNNASGLAPLSSKLFGDFVDESSQILAGKICKKLNKPVYLSCNIEFNRLTSPVIEKRLFQEIKDHPGKF